MRRGRGSRASSGQDISLRPERKSVRRRGLDRSFPCRDEVLMDGLKEVRASDERGQRALTGWRSTVDLPEPFDALIASLWASTKSHGP